MPSPVIQLGRPSALVPVEHVDGPEEAPVATDAREQRPPRTACCLPSAHVVERAVAVDPRHDGLVARRRLLRDAAREVREPGRRARRTRCRSSTPSIAMPSFVEMNVGSSKRLRLKATQGPTSERGADRDRAHDGEPRATTAAPGRSGATGGRGAARAGSARPGPARRDRTPTPSAEREPERSVVCTAGT